MGIVTSLENLPTPDLLLSRPGEVGLAWAGMLEQEDSCVRDRLAAVETRVHSQNDEILCLKVDINIETASISIYLDSVINIYISRPRWLTVSGG